LVPVPCSDNLAALSMKKFLVITSTQHLAAAMSVTTPAPEVTRWVQGAKGQNCDEVCALVDSVCVGSAALRAVGSKAKMQNITAYINVSCVTFVHSSFGTVSPYIAGHSSCQFSDSATSTCSTASPSVRRVCPCGPAPLPEPTFAPTGVKWVKGAKGKDCDTICASMGSGCLGSALREVDTRAKMQTVAASIHVSCASFVHTSFAELSPMIGKYNTCEYSDVGSSNCSGVFPFFWRICPCGSATTPTPASTTVATDGTTFASTTADPDEDDSDTTTTNSVKPMAKRSDILAVAIVAFTLISCF